MADRRGVVIRADGTVPFDDNVPEATRKEILDDLAARGHEVEVHPHTGERRIKGWHAGKHV